MKNIYASFLLAASLLFVFSGCKIQKEACIPGMPQFCSCPDGTVQMQTCRDDGSGWEPCGCTYYSAWCDNDSDLCWQDPQKDAGVENYGGITYADAVRYCEGLMFGGYDDWRLPTIDELRTLVRGNPPTETGGECAMTEGSSFDVMNDSACLPVVDLGGPGSGGCYWPPELTGSCTRPDPGAQGHPLEYMSSSVCPDNGWVGVVMFDNGGVCWNHTHTLAEVRCVRDAPTDISTCVDETPCMPGQTRRCTTADGNIGSQRCAGEGDCYGPCEYTAFTPSPPIKDVCPTCDSVRLTIRVPEKLKTKPAQLMAFFYAADTWSWPPNRPPDGGTSDDQVLNPDIDVDKPLTLTVPGCTYYREQCLSGDYMLYVSLMNSSSMPPVMKEGDYWWGMEQEPIRLGSGQAKVYEMDITLVPYKK